MNVHFTEAANENLVGIHNYIAKNSVRYAQITVDRNDYLKTSCPAGWWRNIKTQPCVRC